MLSKLKQLKKERTSQGFTIIEVMIVLAIAGLILLIVFLAVPALQRSSRNTQRKNDVAALLAAYAEFENNNSGAFPTGAWTEATAGTVVMVGAAGTASSQATVGYYNAGIGTNAGDVQSAAAGSTSIATLLSATGASADYVKIASGTICQGAASVAGPTKSVTAIYEIENGGGTYADQCQAS